MSIDFLHATTAACMAAVVKILARASVRWSGCGPGGVRQRVYFANHISHLDALVLWAALSPKARALTRPVAAREYWTAGPVRRYFAEKIFHAVMIDRQHVFTNAHSPIEPLLAALDDGRSSLILFPEGTRGKGPDIGPFKSGLFYLAKLRPDVELIPTLIENTERILPKGELLPVPQSSGLSFGAPLRVESDETRTDFLSRARAAINGLRKAGSTI